MDEKCTYTYWLDNEAEDCGLCDPPLDPQKGLHFLINYLLDDGWYVAMPESQSQVNSVAVYDILYKYSPKFRRELRKRRRRKAANK